MSQTASVMVDPVNESVVSGISEHDTIIKQVELDLRYVLTLLPWLNSESNHWLELTPLLEGIVMSIIL